MSGFGGWASGFLSGQKNPPKEAPPVVSEPVGDYPWMIKAKAEIGVKETPGPGNTPRVLEYLRATDLDKDDASQDATPWCSAFVSWVLPDGGTHSAWARSYIKYGIKLSEPKYGCICVLSRGPDSGHVGFLIKADDNTVTLLGGNQGDAVSIASFSRDRVLAFRWPSGVEIGNA